jgi:hypothetical protein
MAMSPLFDDVVAVLDVEAVLLVLLELLLDPQAAMKAASDVAAAAPPTPLPTIFRNFLRSLGSRASTSSAPAGCGPVSSVAVFDMSDTSDRRRRERTRRAVPR